MTTLCPIQIERNLIDWVGRSLFEVVRHVRQADDNPRITWKVVHSGCMWACSRGCKLTASHGSLWAPSMNQQMTIMQELCSATTHRDKFRVKPNCNVHRTRNRIAPIPSQPLLPAPVEEQYKSGCCGLRLGGEPRWSAVVVGSTRLNSRRSIKCLSVCIRCTASRSKDVVGHVSSFRKRKGNIVFGRASWPMTGRTIDSSSTMFIPSSGRTVETKRACLTQSLSDIWSGIRMRSIPQLWSG